MHLFQLASSKFDGIEFLCSDSASVPVPARAHDRGRRTRGCGRDLRTRDRGHRDPRGRRRGGERCGRSGPRGRRGGGCAGDCCDWQTWKREVKNTVTE